jgi:uncharacterized protein (TIGR00266 family)
MNIDIYYKPTYSLGLIRLAAGEQVRVESGAMVSMSTDTRVETKATGGVMKSLARKVLTSETFFQNTYTAGPSGGEVTVAPCLPGDLMVVELDGSEAYLVQGGDYVASEMAVQVDSKWGGARTFFGGEGLFMLRCSGQGKLLVSSYGAVHEMQLVAGQRYTVDTGHLVAFSERMGFKLRPIAGLKSTIFSGEGIVVDLTGPGRVLLQTRSFNAFLAFLAPQLPSSGRGTVL